MRVLIISPTEIGIGGISQHVQGLKHYLEKSDNFVEILSSSNTFTIPIKGLKNPSFMISSAIKSKFKKNFDIVHAHNLPSAKAMKNNSGKKILTIHGIYTEQINQLHGNIVSTVVQKYEKNALEWADVITVVSKESYQHYHKLGYNVKQIPNAINIKNLNFQSNKKYKNQIIFAGRLSKEKGSEILLQIAEKLFKNIDLLILGEGPDDKEIKKITRPNIHFLGYQSKQKTIEFLKGSDMLIQPSLHEGISSTILEAMACKIPVIASNIPGNNELLKNQESGLLVENNSDAILESIDQLYSDSNLKNKIIENAFTQVQKFDWESVGKLYLELYNDLLKI